MKIRKDSVAGAAEAISWMERRCGGGQYEEPHPAAANLTDGDMLVCTTGVISIWPGESSPALNNMQTHATTHTFHSCIQVRVDPKAGHDVPVLTEVLVLFSTNKLPMLIYNIFVAAYM
jgi:hypothetical protein